MPRYTPAKIRTSADGIRKVTEAVPIPRGKKFGVIVPELDDSSIVTVEVGNGKYCYPHNVQNISDNEIAKHAKAHNLQVYYTFGHDLVTGLNDKTEIDAAQYEIETNRAHTLTKSGASNTTVDSPSYGGGYSFTTDDYMTLAHASGNKLDLTTDNFSIHTVIKMAATGSKMVIASKRTGTSGDGAGWEIGIDAGSSYPYITIEDASGNTATARAATSIDTSIEKVLHFTIDLAGNGQVYINGTASGAAVAMTGVVKSLTNTRAFKIGCDGAATPGNFWTGTMYMFALYNDVRSAQECKDDFYGGFVPVADITSGSDLVVCASGRDPIFFDLTDYVASMGGKTIRAVCASAQTTTERELTFNFVTED